MIIIVQFSDNKKMCKPYPYQFPLNNTRKLNSI